MFLFLAKSASKMYLMIVIPERKKAFLDSKIRMFYKSKNYRDFGVSPWFW